MAFLLSKHLFTVLEIVFFLQSAFLGKKYLGYRKNEETWWTLRSGTALLQFSESPPAETSLPSAEASVQKPGQRGFCFGFNEYVLTHGV